ncbi:MAG: hypothetical protein ACRETH_09655 [Steroidobacteraceae bacterium]
MRLANPYRSGWGMATLSALAANFNVVALYNNSAAAEMLAVHHLNVIVVGNNQWGLALVNGSFGSLANPVQSVVSGQAAPPGQIFTAQLAPAPTFFYSFGGTGTFSLPWTHDFPLAVLQPNSALLVVSNTVNLALTASFWFTAVHPEMLTEWRDWDLPPPSAAASGR